MLPHFMCSRYRNCSTIILDWGGLAASPYKSGEGSFTALILEVHERLALLQLLPQEGDYKALKTIRRAKEMLSFTPEEQKIMEMKNKVVDGKPQLTWNAGKVNEIAMDVPIDEYITNLFRVALAELNNKGKLTEQTMSLYEKFVVMYQ